MAQSSIEWTDVTWNPVAGCSIVSPGCSNCYAMRMAARLAAMGTEKYAGLTRRSGGRAVWTGKVTFDRSGLTAPFKWTKPRMIFVNSMSDLFQEKVSSAFVQQIWEIMAQAHWHTFQILTKRPRRMAELCENFPRLRNVWLGTSVENSEYVTRIDDLRQVSAAMRFASFEPLIGCVAGVDLTGIEWAIVGGESGPRARPIKREWIGEIQLVH